MLWLGWPGSAAASRDTQHCISLPISLPGVHAKPFPPTTHILHPQLHTCTLHNFMQAAGSSDTPGPSQISSLAEPFDRGPARLLSTIPNPTAALSREHLAQAKHRLKSPPKRGRQTRSREDGGSFGSRALSPRGTKHTEAKTVSLSYLNEASGRLIN